MHGHMNVKLRMIERDGTCFIFVATDTWRVLSQSIYRLRYSQDGPGTGVQSPRRVRDFSSLYFNFTGCGIH